MYTEQIKRDILKYIIKLNGTVIYYCILSEWYLYFIPVSLIPFAWVADNKSLLYLISIGMADLFLFGNIPLRNHILFQKTLQKFNFVLSYQILNYRRVTCLIKNWIWDCCSSHSNIALFESYVHIVQKRSCYM